MTIETQTAADPLSSLKETVPRAMVGVIDMVIATLEEYKLIREKETIELLQRNFAVKAALTRVSPQANIFYAKKSPLSDKTLFRNFIDVARSAPFVIFHLFNIERDTQAGPPDAHAAAATFIESFEKQTQELSTLNKYCEANTPDQALESGYVGVGEGVVRSAKITDYPQTYALRRADSNWAEEVREVGGRKHNITVTGNNIQIINIAEDSSTTLTDFSPKYSLIPLSALAYTQAIEGKFKAEIRDGRITADLSQKTKIILCKDLEVADQQVFISVTGSTASVVGADGAEITTFKLNQEFEREPTGTNMKVKTVSQVAEVDLIKEIGIFEVQDSSCTEKEQVEVTSLVSAISGLISQIGYDDKLRNMKLVVHGSSAGAPVKFGRAAGGNQAIEINLNELRKYSAAQSVIAMAHEAQHIQDDTDNVLGVGYEDNAYPGVSICESYILMDCGEALSEIAAYMESYAAEKKLLELDGLSEDDKQWLLTKSKEDGRFVETALANFEGAPLPQIAQRYLSGLKHKWAADPLAYT